MVRGPRDDDSREHVARLYDRLGASLYRYAAMILADSSAAEDVVQDVFAAMCRSGGAPIESDAAYLYRAVRNACYSVLRRRRRQSTDDAPLLEAVAAEADDPDERLALEQALRALPAEQREVVHLKAFEGMTFREIADLMGESINTVASRYRYAVDKLRDALGVRR